MAILTRDIVDAHLERRAELLDEWVAVSAEIARLEARRAALLAERLDLMIGDARSAGQAADMPFRSMLAEYAAAGHLPQRTVEARMTEAWTLVRLYPETHRALADGSLSARHASVIIGEAPSVSGQPDADEIRAAYEQQVVPFASADTAARTRVHARSVAASLCPLSLTERHRQARHDRSVTVVSDGDGMAVLTAILPEVLAHAIHDRLTSLARKVTADRRARAGAAPSSDTGTGIGSPTEAGIDTPADAPADTSNGSPTGTHSPTDTDTDTDTRTIDQVRADVLADLLLAADPTTITESSEEAIRATIHVTVSAATLAGEDDHPAELEGRGPLLAETARLLAGHAPSWDRLFLDPAGMAVATDNYVPTASMKRFLRARDQRCRFPGCRAPAHRCQIDHNQDFARGGSTEITNLALFCASHHPLKHPDLTDDDRWKAEQSTGGVITWTSPLGRTYSDTPPLRVMFV
ncbi:MAG: DUF222 domain-containing protein [Actinomycetota bacterium]